MLQSLSVGGVDGTTRNRFRGSPAAERVRAKTGTLSGKSCLSGYVGDGHEVLVFSIFVDGIRNRRFTTMAVRAAQVSAVNAMMRFARGIVGQPPTDEVEPGVDFEVGEEILEADLEEKPAEAEGTKPPRPRPPPRRSIRADPRELRDRHARSAAALATTTPARRPSSPRWRSPTTTGLPLPTSPGCPPTPATAAPARACSSTQLPRRRPPLTHPAGAAAGPHPFPLPQTGEGKRSSGAQLCLRAAVPLWPEARREDDVGPQPPVCPLPSAGEGER